MNISRSWLRDDLFTPRCVPQGVMNATSYFQGMMMEVLGNLVGRACLIYVDNVKIIGRSVEGLIVNLRAVLLRCMGRVLFLAAPSSYGLPKRSNGAASFTRGWPSDTTQSACVDWWRCADQRR